MYVEITIQAKNALPDNDKLSVILANKFRNPANKRQALDNTTHKGNYAWEQNILYAYDFNSIVFIIFSFDNDSLIIHVEVPNQRNNLSSLKKNLENLTKRLGKFLKSEGNSLASFSAVIYAEGNVFQTVKMLPWLPKAWESIKDGFETKIFIPIATFFVSWLLQYEVDKAFKNMIITVIVVLIWIFIDATFRRSPFYYKEQ